MATPLQAALEKMRALIDEVVVSRNDDEAYPRMHAALDAVSMAVSAVQAEQPNYERWQLRYMDAEGAWYTFSGPPGNIEWGADELRQFAQGLVAGGAVDVKLQREVPWHTVQSWKGDDLTPGPLCTCPPIPGDGSDEFAPDPQCPQHRDWLPAPVDNMDDLADLDD